MLRQICDLSSEYYFLVPKEGCEFEKLPPIDEERSLDQEKKRLKTFSEFEISKSIILGAMLRKSEIHPLDYVFSSLGCKIQFMDEKCEEAKLIMRYMYHSNGAKDLRVEGIFRVENEPDGNKFKQTSKPRNRKLLWHGTKLSNMMSILSRGMIVDAPYTEITGRFYGNGLYFADIFDKSYKYMDGLDRQGQYMLLCDVALGKSNQVVGSVLRGPKNRFLKLNEAKKAADENKSLHVLGNHVPDDTMTLKTHHGYSIPVGKIVSRKKKDDHRYIPDYSEYIVYNASNVVLRYIVKIGDGSKKYDLNEYLMETDESVATNDKFS